jgi:hypothetical protein
MKKTILTLSVLSSLGAFAQVSPINNHQSTLITNSEATSVWKDMKGSFESGSECFNRAMSWTYDINKKYGYDAKKILIHYSLKYNKELSAKWGYHIAPMYNVDGKDTVLDKGFQPWIHAPLSPKMWEEKFLIAGTEKLVEKRIKLTSKIKSLTKSIYGLDKSSETYSAELKEKRERLREYKAEMIDFKITDADLIKQRPLKIEQTKRWVNYLATELEKTNHSKTKNSLKFQLRFHKSLLQKVETDLNYAAHIQCKKIKNIEELDFNLMGEWCYTQEVSQFYWGVPQLRQLNYGSGQIPPKSDLRRARRAGESFEETTFNMNYVWAARKQAFGSDYKELWSQEYSNKEKSADAVKDIDNVVDDIKDNLKDAKKLVKKIDKYSKKESRVRKYISNIDDVIQSMEIDFSKSKKLMDQIYSVAQSTQTKDITTKVNNLNQANSIKRTSEARLAKLESKLEFIKKKVSDLKKSDRAQRRRNRN